MRLFQNIVKGLRIITVSTKKFLHRYRSSPPHVSLQKDVLKICSKCTPMPKCNFNKITLRFIEVALLHGCSPVNLLHVLKAPFYKHLCRVASVDSWQGSSKQTSVHGKCIPFLSCTIKVRIPTKYSMPATPLHGNAIIFYFMFQYYWYILLSGYYFHIYIVSTLLILKLFG